MRLNTVAFKQTLAAFAVLLAIAPAANAAEIRLHSEATVHGPVVTLGDVAQIASADDEQAAELAGIELAISPPPGEQRSIKAREIREFLSRRGVDLLEHRLSGASRVLVAVPQSAKPKPEDAAASAPARPLSSVEEAEARERFADAVKQYLISHDLAAEFWEIEFRLTAAQAVLLLDSPGEIELSGGDAPWLGEHELCVACGESGATRVEVTVNEAAVVVAAVNPIPAGGIVTQYDVALVRLDKSRPGASACTRLEDAVGQQVTRSFAPGQFLLRDALVPPVLVERGATVMVHVRSAGLEVETQARAREAGSLGQLIVLESLQSRKTFLARVSGSQECEIFAAAPQVRSSASRAPAAVPPGGSARSFIETREAVR